MLNDFMDTKILESVGLSNREAKAYLALLELGSSTVGNIIKKTDIPSSKIYEVLQRLMEKSLVSYVLIKHQKHFQAADPEFLLNELNNKKKMLEELLPALKEKQKFAKEKQSVEMYEGRQAIFKLLFNIVEESKKGDEYLSFTFGEEFADPEIMNFYRNLMLKRKDKGMKIRVLANKRIKSLLEKSHDKFHLETIHNRYTSFNFPQGIVIVKDKVIIMNWKNKPTAILIASSQIAEQFRTFFYELYNGAKP